MKPLINEKKSENETASLYLFNHPAAKTASNSSLWFPISSDFTNLF